MDTELGRIVDLLPGLVWSALPDGCLQQLNRRFLEYTGHDDDRPPGVAWQNAIHPEDLARWLERWRSVPRSTESWELELRLRRSDGAYRWFVCSASPELDASGEVTRWYGVNIDIDEVKRASEALRELQTTISHAAQVATVGELAASIAHEVNQPLAGILTNASTCQHMLAADPPNVDGARETAKRMIRDGRRAADVIARLRALFSKRGFTLESLDLNEATREVIALSLSDLHRNRVIIHSDLANDLARVTGDRIQLQQVILNLIRNAADAMADVHDRPRQLLVKTEREPSNAVRLTVRDSGVGLDQQSLGKLFDAFYTTKADGMGVGLSVSRSIIESHRGHIWASANEGAGATFAFSIPFEAP